MKARHKWTEDDDVIAFYLWKFGDKGLHLQIKEIGEKLGMGAGSLRMRIQNFRAIHGQRGLDNYARQSKQVFDQHAITSRDDLKRNVERILNAR